MRLTRRDLLTTSAQLGALAAVSRVWPAAGVLAQATRSAVAAGKEKLLVRSLRPPDYESPVALLDSWITPIENFYVRSHLPVPTGLDPASWTLQVEGEVATPLTLSMDEIRKLP